ncbi:hypothetical protein H2198_004721 [Neophaeococcomyces mojaviensis]|uniref:Uncharacterized protein n=1 Tax=Neophaeococcomyces mojaviensis TaxID=3383035 RepID=A0ACC3A858_9EURO|nr:hypothetical protein H2198_004721 [Knufia sp. JES_112]
MVQCYYKNDQQPNLIRSINSGVCMGSGSAAGIYSCCFPWDECLPNGFCKTNETVYYTALCTDQTLQDSVCQHACNGLYRTGLKYDGSSELWMCCDNDGYECSSSTNGTFSAPAPQALTARTMTIVDFIPSSTTAVASSTTNQSTSSAVTPNTSTSSVQSPSSAGATTAPSSSTSSPPPQSTQAEIQQSSSLSVGAKAGIGIGAAVLLIALVTGFVFWFLKRRRTNKSAGRPADPTATNWHVAGEMPANAPVLEKYAPFQRVHEADSTPAPTHSNMPTVGRQS